MTRKTDKKKLMISKKNVIKRIPKLETRGRAWEGMKYFVDRLNDIKDVLRTD